MEGLILLGAAFLYFLPTLMALGRHPSAGGILVLNLFLGWTLLGWVVALAWAFNGQRNASGPAPAGSETTRYESAGAARGAADEIERLAALKDKGALTEAEFQAAKAKALAGG